MSDTPDPTTPATVEPTPPRSWRDFLKEYAIIVVGVLTALAAQQAVEWWHWRSEVAQAREAIATELTTNLVGAIYRMRGHACTEQRLNELALVLDTAAKHGSLPPLGHFGMPWRQTFPNGAWESVVASQTATHFPSRLMVDIASTYKMVSRIEEFSGREIEVWSVLYSMVGPGRVLDPASEAQLREALSKVRTDSRIMHSLSIQLIEAFGKLSLSLDRENRNRIAVAQNRPLTDLFICQPVGSPPASYGQGYMNPVMLAPARTDAAMKIMRDISNGVP